MISEQRAYSNGKYRPLSFMEKFKLLFIRGKWFRDGGYACFIKQMNGKAYVLKEQFNSSSEPGEKK